MTALNIIGFDLAYIAVWIWWGRRCTIHNIDHSIRYYMDRYPTLYRTVPKAAEAVDRTGAAMLGYFLGMIWPVSMPLIVLSRAVRWAAHRLGGSRMHVTPTEKAYQREQALKRQEADMKRIITQLPDADREWIEKNGMNI